MAVGAQNSPLRRGAGPVEMEPTRGGSEVVVELGARGGLRVGRGCSLEDLLLVTAVFFFFWVACVVAEPRKICTFNVVVQLQKLKWKMCVLFDFG